MLTGAKETILASNTMNSNSKGWVANNCSPGWGLRQEVDLTPEKPGHNQTIPGCVLPLSPKNHSW